MSTTMKMIKQLPNTSGNSIFELLTYFIYGQRLIPEYDSDKVYNVDDFVTRADPLTGQLSIYVCKGNNITGTWNVDIWEPADINTIIHTLNKKMIMISSIKPDHRYNRLWVQPIDKRDMYIIQPQESFDFTNIQLIFEEEFPVVEEADELTDSQETTLSMDPGDLLFDYEGNTEEYNKGNTYNTGDVVYYVDPISGWLFMYRCLEDGVSGEWDSSKWKQLYSAPSIDDGTQITIRTQESVDIQDIEPDSDGNIIWFDTDLSND